MDRYFFNDSRVTVTDRFTRIDRMAFATRNISSVQRWDRPKSTRPLILAIFCAVMSVLFAISSFSVGALVLAGFAVAAGLYYYFSHNLFFVKVTGGGGDHAVFCSVDSVYVNEIADQIVSAIRE